MQVTPLINLRTKTSNLITKFLAANILQTNRLKSTNQIPLKNKYLFLFSLNFFTELIKKKNKSIKKPF